MRLILIDGPESKRANFYPLTLSRPVFALRVGMSSLAEKLSAKLGLTDVACFIPEYMAAPFALRSTYTVNKVESLKGDDLFIANGRIKASTFTATASGPSEVGTCDNEVCWARINKADLAKLKTDSIEALLASAKAILPNKPCGAEMWNYTWDLILSNPQVLADDFKAAGRSGIEGSVEQPNAIRGDKKNVFIAKGAVVHPMVVIDAEHGPVYLDEGVEVHPFTRIEGPCYVGKKSILLGTKCREGMSIGPMCRVGGEVEESIIQGYSNKYHDGFLGHAYVGEWVNLGALTTNSDLKNDYGSVSVMLDGRTPIDTGSTKVGSLIGDHTKTSIATLFNTGSVIGAMALIMATGKPLPKFIPSFAWYIDGNVTKGFGKGKLYGTAKIAMSRRKCQWTPDDEKMWDAIFAMTAGPRDEAVKRARKAMLK